MIKYISTAMAMKFFSLTPSTRSTYRVLANHFGNKRRVRRQLPRNYLNRVNWQLGIYQKYGVPSSGSKILELGTGWVHWQAIVCLLFFDVQAIAYDVHDNRQFDAFKKFLEGLKNQIDRVNVTNSQREQALARIDQILRKNNFQEVYDVFDLEYRIDPVGRLAMLDHEAFDMIVSCAVLEHVRESDSAAIVDKVSKLLKPGGYSVHTIDLRDHLYKHDKSVSPKQYLAYSDKVWDGYFDSRVLHINRIQRSQWLEMFQNAGLNLISEDVDTVPLPEGEMAHRFMEYSKSDLECGGLRIAHQKPIV